MALEACPFCGKKHDLLSGSIPVSMPTDAARVPVEQRADRVWSNGELCVIDDEQFFLYGSIEISIRGHLEGFAWGAWVEISEELFFWYQDLLEADGREEEAPFQAALGTDIPYYPPTIGLPVTVHIQPKGLRPLFSLADGQHPLIQDQRSGVTVEDINNIRHWFQSLSQRDA